MSFKCWEQVLGSHFRGDTQTDTRPYCASLRCRGWGPHRSTRGDQSSPARGTSVFSGHFHILGVSHSHSRALASQAARMRPKRGMDDKARAAGGAQTQGPAAPSPPNREAPGSSLLALPWPCLPGHPCIPLPRVIPTFNSHGCRSSSEHPLPP